MVFKVTVMPVPVDRTDIMPAVHNVRWVLTYNNFPDLKVYVGDKILFAFPVAPPMFHGVSFVPVSAIPLI